MRRGKFGTVAAIIGMTTVAMALAGCSSDSDHQSQQTPAESMVDSSSQDAENPSSMVDSTDDTKEAGSENQPASQINMDGYTQVWADEFNDDRLNTADWNYETHEPGWVNNELQSYVESDENVYINDGKLVIKPIETKDESGNTTYTSGRVNTQGKHDFTYGIFEASIKMPKGAGFLPAFWMMPTDENLYGQWPRCGEIDIAEVLGNDTKTDYGTIHFGNPHSQSQGSITLEKGDFAEEFHTYAVEWLPGELRWYVDGVMIHTENDWYSVTEGLGEVSYPAPFDQPFYMILNLAVGGDWPGNPDETTDIAGATYEIDYVHVYQKDTYDENVAKPEKDVTLREPDANGNYVTNGDFAVSEDLSDDTDWKFLLALDGEGEATIEDNTIKITSTNAGTADYSVQLVQPGMPMQKGAGYKLTFDAYADEEREMKVALTAPFAGWIRYLNDTTLTLGTQQQTYEFEFDMTEANDPEGRVEFNLGNQGSCATVYISNVKLEKVKDAGESEAAEEKTILSDGNYVYNSKFQEGKNHLGFWEIEENSDVTVEVTPLSDGRRLHVTVAKDLKEAFKISETGLAMIDGEYNFSFLGQGDAAIDVIINGESISYELTDEQTEYSSKFSFDSSKEGAKDLTIAFTKAGEYFIDQVRVVEDVMIKNGSFNAGTSGYEVYVDSSAKANYVVDSLSEDNAMDFTVDETGDADWKIQLKQNNIKLEKGHTYTLKFDAKCDMERSIRAIMQGGEGLGWPVYSGENIVALTSDYQTFSTTFTMEADTDEAAFLSICLGAVDGERISEKHRICVDNISLTEE